MGGDLVRPDSSLGRRLKKLMTVIGVVLVATPLAELTVQLIDGERPQIFLLGGFCLIGILTVSHSIRTRTTRDRIAWGRMTRGRTTRAHNESTPARAVPDRHLAGDALWLGEGET